MQREAGSNQTEIVVHDPAFSSADPEDALMAVGKSELKYFLNDELKVEYVLYK